MLACLQGLGRTHPNERTSLFKVFGDSKGAFFKKPPAAGLIGFRRTLGAHTQTNAPADEKFSPAFFQKAGCAGADQLTRGFG